MYRKRIYAIWAFSNALGDRKLKMYKAIDNIVHQSKDQEGVVMSLLYQTATHFRTLLKLKPLIRKPLKPRSSLQLFENLTPQKKEEFKDNEIIKIPFSSKIMSQSAGLFTGQELIKIIIT